ncbi:uncharacterized protein STAUR_7761 [Stigmatella aurantiaca DW4/3-1]|uniref:Uncharacterized protein n=2 Tax=Stigmatella aurantiaca TaxID=41 RepID=E3FLR7_STIAD|nr:uncharacterized protein STAUR_7761 [Stigmatella aurantiaca DW4/3-1]
MATHGGFTQMGLFTQSSSEKLLWFPVPGTCHEFFGDSLLNGGSFSEAFAKIWERPESGLSVLLPRSGKGLDLSCSMGGLGDGIVEKSFQCLLRSLASLRGNSGNLVCLIEDSLAAPGDPFWARYPFARTRGGQVFHAVGLPEFGTGDAERAIRRLSGNPPGFGCVVDLGAEQIPYLEKAGEAEIEGVMARYVLAFIPAFDGETYLMATAPKALGGT